MHLIKSGGTKSVNTRILNTVAMNTTPTGFTGTVAVPPVLFAGSQVSVNTITGNFSEKWILETGDKIVIRIDDTTTTGYVGTTLGSANASTNWVDNQIATMDTFSGADTLRTAGTYNGVTGTSGGSGIGHTFNIIVDGAGAITSVVVATGGTGHAVNDTITIANTSLGSGGGAHATMDTFSAADASRTAGTYTGVTGTSGGSGTVGTFNIVVDGTGAVTGVTVVTGGSGHAVDDTITIADAVLGGGGAAVFTMDVATLLNAADFTMDVATIVEGYLEKVLYRP